MNYLSDYINKSQTAILKKYGAFYAFSNQQFKDKMIDGVKYESRGMGLIVPLGKSKDLDIEIDALYKKGIQQDIVENGISKIIHRELANHECQITGDYQNVIELMSDYGITADQVHAEYSIFYDHCVANEYF
jgi:hypothetical protein